MSKFHNYSIGNCAKIEEQFSGARAVGSFKFWKDNGFTVNKGENYSNFNSYTYQKFL